MNGILRRLFVVGVILVLYVCYGQLLFSQGGQRKNPIDVSIYDLGLDPQKFDGQYIRIRALLVVGWEGDNFLSDPDPRNIFSGGPAYALFYCKPEQERQIWEQIKPNGSSILALFTGYFHYVPKPQPNAMFDPGHLQFEAVDVSSPKPSETLSDAIKSGNLEKVRSLLHSGAKINILDQYRSLPLFEAASGNHLDIVEELLAAGADPNATLPDGSTSLIAAAFYGNVEIARVLLDHGASAKAANVHGETALIMAPHNNSDGNMVQLLLDAGAEPNAKTANGMTALQAAAMDGDAAAAEILLKAGADPTAKDEYGDTVEGESCDRGDRGHSRVCELIKQALHKK